MVDSRCAINNYVAWQVGCSIFRARIDVFSTDQKVDDKAKMLSLKGDTTVVNQSLLAQRIDTPFFYIPITNQRSEGVGVFVRLWQVCVCMYLYLYVCMYVCMYEKRSLPWTGARNAHLTVVFEGEVVPKKKRRNGETTNDNRCKHSIIETGNVLLSTNTNQPMAP